MRIFGICKYKGTNYYGWQKQPHDKSIQEEIESALFKLYGEKINIYGSGRTDSGVHAFGQTFHFDIAKEKYSSDELKYRLNCILPYDIQIVSLERVNDDFHARFSAKAKTYCYRLISDAKDPFNHDFVWLFPEPFDKQKIKDCLALLKGKHNFRNFTSKEEDEDNYIRTIYLAKYDEKNNTITFKGNGFMRYQIRFMVGAIMAVASGKENIGYIKELRFI